MGCEGRALAEQTFSWPRVAEAFLRLSSALVHGRPPMLALTEDLPY
jgi:hypothetical protein